MTGHKADKFGIEDNARLSTEQLIEKLTKLSPEEKLLEQYRDSEVPFQCYDTWDIRSIYKFLAEKLKEFSE